MFANAFTIVLVGIQFLSRPRLLVLLGKDECLKPISYLLISRLMGPRLLRYRGNRHGNPSERSLEERCCSLLPMLVSWCYISFVIRDLAPANTSYRRTGGPGICLPTAVEAV